MSFMWFFICDVRQLQLLISSSVLRCVAMVFGPRCSDFRLMPSPNKIVFHHDVRNRLNMFKKFGYVMWNVNVIRWDAIFSNGGSKPLTPHSYFFVKFYRRSSGNVVPNERFHFKQWCILRWHDWRFDRFIRNEMEYFTLVFAVIYLWRSSITTLDKQFCSFWW